MRRKSVFCEMDLASTSARGKNVSVSFEHTGSVDCGQVMLVPVLAVAVAAAGTAPVSLIRSDAQMSPKISVTSIWEISKLVSRHEHRSYCTRHESGFESFCEMRMIISNMLAALTQFISHVPENGGRHAAAAAIGQQQARVGKAARHCNIAPHNRRVRGNAHDTVDGQPKGGRARRSVGGFAPDIQKTTHAQMSGGAGLERVRRDHDHCLNAFNEIKMCPTRHVEYERRTRFVCNVRPRAADDDHVTEPNGSGKFELDCDRNFQ